jgi:ribosomal-protein-alanine N-acetyltransferase
LKVVIEYCQQQKDIHRLEAFVEEGNVASSKVLEKVGFVYEGMMRDCEIKNGKFISLFIYALITGRKDLPHRHIDT